MSSHSPSPSPSPWQPGIPLSVLVDLPVSDISYQWNHMRYGFLHLRNVWGFIHVVARVTLTDWIVSPPCICGPQTGYTGRHSESRTQFIVSKHPPHTHTLHPDTACTPGSLCLEPFSILSSGNSRSPVCSQLRCALLREALQTGHSESVSCSAHLLFLAPPSFAVTYLILSSLAFCLGLG